MYRLQQTDIFSEWLARLRDLYARGRIVARLRSIGLGNLGDTKSVGGGVSEARIDVGPGYRIYFTRRQQTLVILLCGGDKSTQARDIERAQKMAKHIE